MQLLYDPKAKKVDGMSTMVVQHTWWGIEKCEIRRKKSGRLVGTTSRTPNNIYNLDEIGKESCCLVKEYESWLWNKRMGHMHFGNLVKINKKEAVRDMP